MSLRVLLAIFSLVICVVCSCTSSLGTFQSLANQGLLPLSSENAYLGTNLLLAKEMEKSSYLYNFFEGRGAPRAIEVFDGEQGLELALYYPNEGEMYLATLVEDSKTHQWIMRGPVAPGRERAKMMARLAEIVPNEPIFEIHGQAKWFGKVKESETITSKILVPVILPTPTLKPIPKPKHPIIKLVGPTPTAKTTPANFDQEVLERAQAVKTP